MNVDEFDEEDKEEQKSYKQFEIREGIIFLIEITKDILTPLQELNGKSQLSEILSSINDLLSELIITMRLTGIGIYFYNCQDDNTKLLKSMVPVTPGFVKLFGLNYINMKNIKLLNDIIIDDHQKIRSIDYIFRPKSVKEDHLPIILNTLIDEFQRKRVFNKKRLIWFTNNDRPYTKKSSKEHLWRIINDYYNFGYFIQPIFLNKPDSDFNMSLYEDIFLNTNYMPKHDLPNQKPREYSMKGVFKHAGMFKQTMLNTRIRSSIFRLKEIKRIQFACNLILSDGKGVGGNLGCSIKGYTLYSTEKTIRDFYMYINDDGFKRVFMESNLVNQETDEIIKLQQNDDKKSITQFKEDNNIRRGFKLAGDEVVFLDQQQLQFLNNFAFDHDISNDEKTDEDSLINDVMNGDDDNSQEISYSTPPYLKMVGFRDIETFKPYYNSQAPIFVTPDMFDGLGTTSTSGGYENSFKTFSALYQSCKKAKKYMIVFGCNKKNAKPSLYIFYPTRIENSSRNEGWNFPEGFLMIRLPWLDDIRSLPNYFLDDAENQFDTNDEAKVTMGMVPYFKKLISQFFFNDYNPQDYPNPSLNYFHKIMKHELLQMELTDQDKDMNKNDISSLKLLELSQFIKGDPERLNLIKDINSKLKTLLESIPKRYIPETSSSIAKKQKVNLPALDEDAILTAWKNDDWNYFTVAQLKQFQKQYKNQIPSATKKQDIINNIKKFLDSRKIKEE